MQEGIVNHLKEIHKPDAIILHGSRARGKEREHSDWDFIFLYNNATDVKNGRELYRNQNIEFSVHSLANNIEDIENEFSTKLQQAKVVYEKNKEGTNLLKQAESLYKQGVHWTSDKLNDHKLWMQGRINGMRDNVDNSTVFTKYLADLYQRLFNYWYWIVQNSYSQPFYIAVEEVGTKDPEYCTLVSQLADSRVPLEEKVAVAEKIKERLFSE